MIVADAPAQRPDVAAYTRDRWRSITASPAALATLLAAVALGIRSVGLIRSFELWVDEMLYADLGASVSHGEMPRLADGPFFLHPPGFFLLEAGTIRVFGLRTSDSMSLVYDLRWLTAVLGALTVAAAFLLVRTVAGTWPAVWASLALAFEPFVLRINSRVFLETPGTLAVVAGLLVLAGHLERPGRSHARLRLLGAGLLLGWAVLTKDTFVFYAVVPVLLAVVWKRTLALRDAAVTLVGVLVPYLVYLAVLLGTGYLPAWWTAKSAGILRLVGAEHTTGFNAAGAPSLAERLATQAEQYGTSYLLLVLCPLAGLVAVFSARPARRLIGLTAIVMGAYGAYLVAFGTLEEQFVYPIVVAGVVAVAVVARMAVSRRPRLTRVAAPVLGLFLAVAAALGVVQATTPDDGFLTFRGWAADHLAADARVGVTNDTAVRAFSDDPRFGPWSTAALLEENGADYVLTVSLPTEQGYALARPSFLTWLAANATPVFRDSGRTNGATVLWHIDPPTLAAAAAAGVGGPAPAALDAGTAGAGASTGTGGGR